MMYAVRTDRKGMMTCIIIRFYWDTRNSGMEVMRLNLQWYKTLDVTRAEGAMQ